MTMLAGDRGDTAYELWEKEILARHRWGQHGERASEEFARLKQLWEAVRPLSQPLQSVMGQIVALEICNWNLEASILALCRAIGAEQPAELGIGHLASVTGERWRGVWDYYLSLRDWLPSEGRSGYGELLRVCDPHGGVQQHVLGLLGERDRLKELYVERFSLVLEFWLSGLLPQGSAQMMAHRAAASAVEGEIQKLDPDGRILDAMRADGDGKLQPCHHKAFRRYDVILSSIGAGKWRAVMPMRGTDGIERAATLETYLSPIESWIGGGGEREEATCDEPTKTIRSLLREQDDAKVFLASLLVSLLRAQQLSAKQRAGARLKQSEA